MSDAAQYLHLRRTGVRPHEETHLEQFAEGSRSFQPLHGRVGRFGVVGVEESEARDVEFDVPAEDGTHVGRNHRQVRDGLVLGYVGVRDVVPHPVVHGGTRQVRAVGAARDAPGLSVPASARVQVRAVPVATPALDAPEPIRHVPEIDDVKTHDVRLLPRQKRVGFREGYVDVRPSQSLGPLTQNDISGQMMHVQPIRRYRFRSPSVGTEGIALDEFPRSDSGNDASIARVRQMGGADRIDDTPRSHGRRLGQTRHVHSTVLAQFRFRAFGRQVGDATDTAGGVELLEKFGPGDAVLEQIAIRFGHILQEIGDDFVPGVR
mmetsp:Transcript_22721/g.46079  ORF Transcript_22721/g.46079 Transcript_22721/m.46079 type:complete len:320 (+) Transcript_22721:1529-2488(+)